MSLMSNLHANTLKSARKVESKKKGDDNSIKNKLNNNAMADIETNTVGKQSPFVEVLTKSKENFPGCKEKNDVLCKKSEKEAEDKITELRGKTIQEVTKYFVDLAVDEKNYWLQFYILSNVALLGNSKSLSWEDNTPAEDPTGDAIFNELKAAEATLTPKFKTCKQNTLKGLYTMAKSKKLNLKAWAWKDVARNTIELKDFEHNMEFMEEIRKTPFFQHIENNFPKGIIHHYHWSAGFSYEAVHEALDKYLTTKNADLAKSHVIILRVNFYPSNKAMEYTPGNDSDDGYLEYTAPVLIPVDIVKAKVEYEKIKGKPAEVAFKNAAIKNNDSSFCVKYDGPDVKDLDVIGYLYLIHCKHVIVYYKDNLEAVQAQLDGDLKKLHGENLFREVVKSRTDKSIGNKKNNDLYRDFVSLKKYLKRKGTILRTDEQLQHMELPEKYAKLIGNVRDTLSASFWYMFENIFGMYGYLYGIEEIVATLNDRMSKEFSKQKLSGVEFRNKDDTPPATPAANPEPSVTQHVREDFKRDKLLYTFIVPGRKALAGMGIDKVTAGSAKKIQESKDFSGIDFFGYEDDSFNGARNFFSNLINLKVGLKDDAGKPIQESNAFSSLFTKKPEMYLHAGETNYFPDYAITKEFMNKYYINDNLFHAVLLPNVKRLGHGFAAIRNDLIFNIIKAKKISLEICPVSNEALKYYDVNESPIGALLRKGAIVTVSPDDPGLFGYLGVTTDWFKLFMESDLKAHEFYLLIKNSFDASGNKINTQAKAEFEKVKINIKDFFTKNWECGTDVATDADLKFDAADKTTRIENAKTILNKLKDFVKKNYTLISGDAKAKLDVEVSIYNSKEVYDKKLNMLANILKKAAADILAKKASGSAPAPSSAKASGSAPAPLKPSGKTKKKL